jgi:hypothetical protein
MSAPYERYAHSLFQFVAVASRRLRVEELADLLAFDFEARPVPVWVAAVCIHKSQASRCFQAPYVLPFPIDGVRQRTC